MRITIPDDVAERFLSQVPSGLTLEGYLSGRILTLLTTPQDDPEALTVGREAIADFCQRMGTAIVPTTGGDLMRLLEFYASIDIAGVTLPINAAGSAVLADRAAREGISAGQFLRREIQRVIAQLGMEGYQIGQVTDAEAYHRESATVGDLQSPPADTIRAAMAADRHPMPIPAPPPPPGTR